FTGWSGDCSGANCGVTLSGHRQVNASFAQAFQLSVSKTGTGSGTIVSTDSLVNCGTTCSQAYPGAALVTLVATPGADSRFGGWTGACTSANATCTVTMSAARLATAVFKQVFDLSVSKLGAGNGSIT